MKQLRRSCQGGLLRALPQFLCMSMAIMERYLCWRIPLSTNCETTEEIEFVKQTGDVLRSALEKIESDDSVKRINSVLLDTYNYIDEGIFIREVDTGRVLFSNRTLNDMLGYDFTDKDSKLLIENLRDKYKLMGGSGSASGYGQQGGQLEKLYKKSRQDHGFD